MYDYVVVGAGSAGCVIARRLSDDPSVKVALVEAGPAKHRSLKVRAPALYQLLWRTPLDWNIVTEPQPHVADRAMYWPRGEVAPLWWTPQLTLRCPDATAEATQVLPA